MNYLSVCSGIEAATVAWHHMGWKPVGFSEIEKFPSQVLAHHYPQVTNFGDMTKYKEWQINDPIGLLVGGTPCQSFSVAGLRKGLEDPRGNLALTYVGILDHFRPKWFIWENVPGVLSSGGGETLAASSVRWANSGMGGATGCLMLNTLESHKDADECLLSDILETGDLPQKYYLSPVACKGILRRAEKRGKHLPPMLQIALERCVQEITKA
jgi:DNA (cytosine-5)-methyltransferase 1